MKLKTAPDWRAAAATGGVGTASTERRCTASRQATVLNDRRSMEFDMKYGAVVHFSATANLIQRGGWARPTILTAVIGQR
jgi:hypothetical protein